jgi:hypothetical protein
VKRRAFVVCFCALAMFAVACAYVLPASWRAFRVDPDDAAPAITRALDGHGLAITSFDQAKRRIVSQWVVARDATSSTRSRYVISWERDTRDGALTVYVRHENQETSVEGGSGDRWGAVFHDSTKEEAMLDAIQKELERG